MSSEVHCCFKFIDERSQLAALSMVTIRATTFHRPSPVFLCITVIAFETSYVVITGAGESNRFSVLIDVLLPATVVAWCLSHFDT